MLTVWWSLRSTSANRMLPFARVRAGGRQGKRAGRIGRRLSDDAWGVIGAGDRLHDVLDDAPAMPSEIVKA